MSPTRTRFLLLAGLAPALYVVVLLLDSATRPDYDPLDHFGSEPANGDRGWLMITNFIATGTLTICFALGLRDVLRPGRGALAAPVFVGLFGLGLVVAGVFVADPKPGYPAGSTGTANPTLHSQVHDGNLFPTWTVMTIAMLVLAVRFAADKRGWMWYSIASAVAAMTTLLVAVALHVFLKLNGARFTPAAEDDLFTTVIDTATHALDDVPAITKRIRPFMQATA